MRRIVFLSGFVCALLWGCSKQEPTQPAPGGPGAGAQAASEPSAITASAASDASVPQAAASGAVASGRSRPKDDCDHTYTTDTCKTLDCLIYVTVDEKGNRTVKPYDLMTTKVNPVITWHMDPGSTFKDKAKHGVKDGNQDRSLTGGKEISPGVWKAQYVSAQGATRYVIKFDKGGQDKSCDPTINTGPIDEDEKPK